MSLCQLSVRLAVMNYVANQRHTLILELSNWLIRRSYPSHRQCVAAYETVQHIGTRYVRLFAQSIEPQVGQWSDVELSRARQVSNVFDRVAGVKLCTICSTCCSLLIIPARELEPDLF